MHETLTDMKKIFFNFLPVLFLVTALLGFSFSAQAQKRGKMRNSRHHTERTVSKHAKRAAKDARTATVSHTEWEPNKMVSVTFDEFPATIEQWQEMQKKLGGEPQGAVALQVMAFELYRNNRADGEKALKLNNTATNYNSTVGRLREIMGKDQYYARPYIAWAMLRGATPENGYTVRPPYVIDIKVDPNKKYQESQLLKGTVIYLLLDSKGWDTNWRGVEVVKPAGSDYFVVSNCPAMYTQCKESKR